MKPLLVFGTAILLAGSAMTAFYGSQLETCLPAGTGCTNPDYLPAFVGIVLVLLGIVVVVLGRGWHPKAGRPGQNTPT
ncbi:MAG TPA: hypothetical protein VJR06_06205 [Nitrososphaerales archaeon]|nr:hypothetical protein [Nitrososphaerales archaeon]